MRKIRCQTCPPRRLTETPIWVIFDDVRICEMCRLAAIEYLRALGFSLARPHPFLDELIQVESRRARKNPVDIQIKT